jgi:hypothetical protein
MANRRCIYLVLGFVLLASSEWGNPRVMSAAEPDSSRWSWLGENGGTYWYVPTENLLAFRWETSTPQDAKPVKDQTVWHIQRYENGYIFGPIVVKLGLIPRLCQYLIGSVTPDGRVYISFNSLQTIPTGTPSLTTGIGQLVRVGREWAFNMQMASGSSSSQVTHRALMRQCTPADACWTSLPGVQRTLAELLASCE